HSVDLDMGVTFADVPEDVQAALIDEVFRVWDRREVAPDVVLFAGDREWGTGSLAVAGTLPDVTAWVTGRSAGDGLSADGPLPDRAAVPQPDRDEEMGRPLRTLPPRSGPRERR